MSIQAAEDLNVTDLSVCDSSNKVELRLVEGFVPSMPRLDPADPRRAEKISWADAHCRTTFRDLGMKYDIEALAATFEDNVGLNSDYDLMFREDAGNADTTPEQRMDAAAVPYAVAQAALGYRPSDALQSYVREIMEPHGPSAWLVGGASATLAAAWILGHVDSGLYVDFTELVAEVHGRSKFGEDGSAAFCNGLRSPRVLVLDGLDSVTLDQTTAEVMFPTFRHRHLNAMPTIITAMSPIDEVMLCSTSRCRSMFGEVAAALGTTTAERAEHMLII